MYGNIYLIRNIVNNKIYIGQTIMGFKERYHNNFFNNTHNEHIKRSVEKYGKENFYIDDEFDVAFTKEELNKLEDMYIKLYNTTDRRFGYNKKFGGAHGKHTKATKIKMKENHSDISGENNPMWGRQHSNETRKLISKIHKGKRSGENNHFYGKKHSEETKKKIGDKNRGKIKGEKNFFYGVSMAGSENPNAKPLKVIYPNGDEIIFGTFQECKEHLNVGIDLVRMLVKSGNPYKINNYNKKYKHLENIIILKIDKTIPSQA